MLAKLVSSLLYRAGPYAVNVVLPIQDNQRRQRERPIGVDHLRTLVVQDRERSVKLCHRFLYLLDASIIIDRQNRKLLVGELIGNAFGYGKLPQTCPSSNTPEFEKHRLPLELLE